MANEKYRVHEVAKDFNLPTKTITEILTKYVAAPKNHMQVLTDHELSVIFDYLTAHNQVSGIQAIYADIAPKAEQPKAEQPKQEPQKKPEPKKTEPKKPDAKKSEPKKQESQKQAEPKAEASEGGESAKKPHRRPNHHRRRKPRSGEPKSE